MATSTNHRTGTRVPATYLGKRDRFADHIGAVAGWREASCRASFSGAIGDCTRAAGHAGPHQNAATAESWEEVEAAPAPRLAGGHRRMVPVDSTPRVECINIPRGIECGAPWHACPLHQPERYADTMARHYAI